MTRQIVLVAVVAALAGGVFGFLLRPAPGGGETRPQVPRAAAVDRPIGTGRPGYVALNMEPADNPPGSGRSPR